MEKYKKYFKGKKITVMGLGLLGRGVGDTLFLAECGADIIVTDLKSGEELKESLDQLSGYKDISYTLGEHKEEDFKGRDMILQAAGVPSDAKYLQVAREDGADVVMSGMLFAKLSGVPIIGITGTRGKSTVTHMIHHVLNAVTDGDGVILGGNVRGVSNLQLLKDIKEDSIAVMELDSWQLQGFGYKEMSPQVSVFTNFMEDHMNYYKGDMGSYFRDKAQIFAHQEESGVFITTQEVFEQAQQFMKSIKKEFHQEVKLVDSSVLPEDCLLKMPGEHNRLNAAFALEALRATGLSDEEIFFGLTTFPGVSGRLEYMGEKDGVKIYNDNNATTPTAMMRGLEAVTEQKNVVLIAGGSYKDLDGAILIPYFEKYCKKVILLPGVGTDMLLDSIKKDSSLDSELVATVSTMEEAVKKSIEESKEGDVILLSPGFASFGLFKNEFDRGDRFVAAVNKVLEEQED